MGHPKVESIEEQADELADELAGEEGTGPDGKRLPIYHPETRGDCKGEARPCPLVGCSMNLFLNVDDDGQISYTFPGREVWDMPPGESCLLDVLDVNPDGLTLEETGRMLNVTRERIRQVEEGVKRRIRKRKYLLRKIGDPDDVRKEKTARIPDDSREAREAEQTGIAGQEEGGSE